MILVTGTSGFIGKHLLNALVHTYGRRNILALTSQPIVTTPFLLHHEYRFNKDYFVHHGYNNIETIIHAGAFTPKSKDQNNNIVRCNSNILNTEVLITSNFPNLRKIILLSTLDVYGNTSVITEQTEVAPISLYGSSKLYTEEMVRAWAKDKNIIPQVLRIGHVYGPGEEQYQKIIPVSINKLLRQETMQIWGTGNEIRSFIFIRDVVRAIMQAIKLEEGAGIVNLVSEQKITIKELVYLLKEISGSSSEVEFLGTTSGMRDLIFDNTKMKKLLLSAETPLKQGLTEEWTYMKAKYQ